MSGRVHLSTPDGDCFGIQDDLLEPVVGAVVQLLDATGQVLAEALTAEDGTYLFDDLVPGEYGVREITPPSLIDGGAHVGSVAGEARGQVNLSGEITNIRLGSDEQGINFDFCEHQPSTLSGHVYGDENNDGVRDPAEVPIAAVQVQLIDESGKLVAETETDASGRYTFSGLTPSRYTIREIHPTGWIDGTDSAGTVEGQTRGVAQNPGDEILDVALRWGEVGSNYDFGELRPASLSGMVHSSPQEDCWNDEQSEPLAGVRIWLLQANGNIVAETVTDLDGRYEFTELEPGVYTVEQEQPNGVFQGSERAGSAGGDASVDNVISQIVIAPGEALTDYDFCELPPASLSGFVFQDGPPIRLSRGEALPDDLSHLRNGELTPDDRRLPGVVLELRRGISGEPVMASEALAGVYPPGPITATTDANGFYEFTGLPKGNYAVYERHPEGFLDGIDTPGTTDGIAINPTPPGEGTIFLETVVSTLVEPPRNDAIVRIGLPSGVHSQHNNFSEVLTRESPSIIVFPDGPPPSPLPPPITITLPEPTLVPRQLEPQVLREVRFRPDGSSSAQGNTWHLSIIDGGQPRVARPAEDGSFLIPASFWQPNLLREGQWTINAANDVGTSEIFVFGVRGGIPIAGDFNGDGVSEIGVFYKGQWFIDLNGNGRWNGSDLWARLGHEGDLPVTGDWDGDGKDDIGIYGRAWPGDPRAVASEPGLPDLDNTSTGKKKNMPPSEENATLGRRVMQLTAVGRLRADLIDHVFLYGAAGDHPVSGDWNGDGIDTIGVFRDGTWRLDVDGNGRWTDADQMLHFGAKGDIPLVGDFNGDGVDDIAIYRDGKLYMDTNGNRQLDASDVRLTFGDGRRARRRQMEWRSGRQGRLV